jgi:hypothetical protein
MEWPQRPAKKPRLETPEKFSSWNPTVLCGDEFFQPTQEQSTVPATPYDWEGIRNSTGSHQPSTTRETSLEWIANSVEVELTPAVESELACFGSVSFQFQGCYI